MEAFAKSVDEYTTAPRVLIMGMLKDKDITHSLNFIDGKFDTVFTLTVDNPRTISNIELAKMCEGKFNNAIPCETPEKAINKALALADEINGTVMICGSLYLAGEIRPILMNKFKK